MVEVMKSKMKSLRLCFLIFLLFQAAISSSQGCSMEERQALVGLSSHFDISFSVSSHTDCCEWEGVVCNSSTGRVAELFFDSLRNSEEQYINYSDFSVFRDLKELDLGYNNIVGCVGGEGLPNLEVLDLTYNKLDNAARILSCLDTLSSLKSLYLRGISLNTSSLNYVFKSLSSELRNLEVLDLSSNNFNDDSDIASALSGLSSLKSLYLLNTQLTWRSIFNISKLNSLETLGLGGNQLNGSILRPLDNEGFKWPTNLQVLSLERNSFTNKILSFLSGLPRLKSLDLSNNQLEGLLNISALKNLEELDLSWNNLNNSEDGGFTWPTNLQVLRLLGNNLSNKFLSSLSGLPRLNSLDLSYNQLEGSVDISGLSTSTNLSNLDLSNNQIHNFMAREGSKNLNKLDALVLAGNMIDGNKLRDSLRILSSSIRVIDITENTLKGAIVAEDFKDLSNLKNLTLDGTRNMENKFFKTIGELTSLKLLTLSGCHINGTLPSADWSKLKKLEKLDLSTNRFDGPLPSSFRNMTSLRILDLSQNHFIGQLDYNIASLPSLEYFSFTENQFEIPISFTPFANHSNLQFIYGYGNKVILDLQPSLQTWIPKFQLQVLILSSTSTETNSFQLPKFLLYQNHLTILDLSSWRLEGGFPSWLLENNTKLTEIFFSNCSLSGIMQLPLHPLPNIGIIDVSDNIIVGKIPNKNISSIYPNLEILNLSSNHIQGSIPRELCQINSLYQLDLSNNQLSGVISDNIFEAGCQLSFLKLSNNMFEGPIFTIPTHLEYLYLNDNNFTGRFPNNIFNTSIMSLDVSNNHLVGKIPRLINNLSRISFLCMSNNHFEGFIPLELAQHENLEFLDLSQNNLIGLVPIFLNSFVKFIHLNNNRLTGLSKKMFNENSSLVMLDLSYNEISSNIEDMIQDLSYTKLNFLLLKGNYFIGNIPDQLCHLKDLTMLDLSHNKFSSAIPHCLGKMPFDNKNLDSSLQNSQGNIFFDKDYMGFSAIPSEQKKEKASFTSKKRIDTYMGSILTYMSGIDLSHNKLKGNVPYEFGNLKRIRVLNLSHNDLTGQIPDSFSNLVQTESLDLSFNKLSGQIPPQLNILTSLEVFSVAYNNLSGPTPERTKQFATFDESSYEGNLFLCGPPLPKSCNPTPTIIPDDSDIERDNGSSIDMYIFYVSFVVAYIFALLATAIALYINPYWRQAWFYNMELMDDSITFNHKEIIYRVS